MGFQFGRTAAASVLVAAMTAGAAVAHDMGKLPDTPAGRALGARHQNFKQLGGAFKVIMDQLKQASPDKAAIAASAQKMNTLAGQLPNWFPKGSGPESGLKTEAKAEVWTDSAGFAAAAQRLQQQTAKLQQFAAAGDLDAVKAQARETGAACKNCHDKYRVPDKD